MSRGSPLCARSWGTRVPTARPDRAARPRGPAVLAELAVPGRCVTPAVCMIGLGPLNGGGRGVVPLGQNAGVMQRCAGDGFSGSRLPLVALCVGTRAVASLVLMKSPPGGVTDIGFPFWSNNCTPVIGAPFASYVETFVIDSSFRVSPAGNCSGAGLTDSAQAHAAELAAAANRKGSASSANALISTLATHSLCGSQRPRPHCTLRTVGLAKNNQRKGVSGSAETPRPPTTSRVTWKTVHARKIYQPGRRAIAKSSTWAPIACLQTRVIAAARQR